MNTLNINGYWDRTPIVDVGKIKTATDHPLIPKPCRIEIERSGVNVEIYSTEKPINVGPLMLWSPKDGGTLHIEHGLFARLRFLDRMVAIRLSLLVHRLYSSKELKLTSKLIIWDNKDYSKFWGNILDEYKTGCRRDAMEAAGRLPWFAGRRPSHLNEESLVCHAQTLDRIYASHRGPNRGKKYA